MNDPDVTPGKGKARLLLVDDHPVVLSGYQLMLDAHPEFEVCATATNEDDALVAVAREHPSLVITDLSMPGRGGLELIKELHAMHPALKVLVFSMHDEALYARRALQAGAKGYLTKDSPGPVMLHAIRRVLEGGTYVSERLAAQLAKDALPASAQAGCSAAMEKLSTPEKQVFRLFGEGRTAKEISAQLDLSLKAVSHYRDDIKEKLAFSTSAEMIRKATRWVDSERSR